MACPGHVIPHAPRTPAGLIQPLKTAHRSPGRFYKSQAFAAFAPGSLNRSFVLPPGWYACAFRFVNALTGQMTELVTVGVVQVG